MTQSMADAAGQKKTPWILEKKAVWIGIIVLGPFALPFLWLSPKFSLKSKFWISVPTVILMMLMLKFSGTALELLEKRLAEWQNRASFTD